MHVYVSGRVWWVGGWVAVMCFFEVRALAPYLGTHSPVHLPTTHTPTTHPSHGQLAVLSITDHFTRVKMGLGAAAMGAAPPRVFGMLFGRQSGRKVEIYEAKELNVVVGDGRGPLVFCGDPT